jgi:hypothetical protein
MPEGVFIMNLINNLKKGKIKIILIAILAITTLLTSCAVEIGAEFQAKSDNSPVLPDPSPTMILTAPTFNSLPAEAEAPPEAPVVLTDSIIQDIDDRVAWIVERLGGYPFRGNDLLALGDFACIQGKAYADYYDGDELVYRRGNEYYKEIEGDVFYYLFYDKEGRLIYADILQYRHPTYCIYFYNGTAIRLTRGERENEEETVFDEYMINAITLCLENAYILPDYSGVCAVSDDSISIRLYEYNDPCARLEYFDENSYTFTTIQIPTESFLEEAIKQLYLNKQFSVDNLWYEGSRLYIDLNLTMVRLLDAGSTGGAISSVELLLTFASFPGADELVFFLGGKEC